MPFAWFESASRQVRVSVVLGASLFAASTVLSPVMAAAQSVTAGDISGTVTDTTGAAVPNASITVVNPATGAKKTAKSDAGGSYRVSLLGPGAYHVTVATSGFETETTDLIVSAGVVTVGDVKLKVGSASTTVDVSAEAPLLHTESAEISTEFTQEQIANLPNPGNDLTFIAQTAPGAVMNTQGGYGNFSAFGLPATANTFTVNGGYENDPFLNVNNSGATNLLLGNNDVGTVTVLSNAYGAQYGGLGGTQVNEITRSGTNRFHGDATYYWNGSLLNANDYFNNQQGVKKPRSNANQWSGALGGPIFKDRTFFFFNTEGLRVIIPVRGEVYAPSSSYIATTEANAAAQSPAALAFYQKYFSVYTANPLYAAATPDSGDPTNAVDYAANSANFAHEAQYTGRIDHRLTSKDNVFFHMTYDTGTQPTFTSLLNPIFNAQSPQPQWSGQFNETHVFSPNITNQFVFAELYYKAIFQNTNQTAASALAPFSVIFLSGAFANNGLATTPGGLDYAWPQGRDVNGYQFVDDFSWNRGKHTFKVGMYERRDDVTDYGPGVLTTPLIESTEGSFEAASADIYIQQFPLRKTQPVSLYNLGLYVQDEWKPVKDLVVTAGIRFEHNSNPVCHTNCFARLSQDFTALSASATTPYSNASGNGLIDSGLHSAFSNFQKVGYEPRFGFAYTPSQLNSKVTIRGGFGIFADAFPAQIADSLLNNAPTNVGFTVLGAAFGNAAPLYPGAAGSFSQQASGSAAAFRSGFATGGNLTTLATDPNFTPPSFYSPASKISYPTYEEYNLAIERQLGKSTTISAQYVGNHTYHQPVVNNSVNSANAGGAPGFAGYTTTTPNQNFGQVTDVYSGASSNYNGLTVTATKRSSYLTLQFNYTWSHALDEISNGGFNGFSGNSVNPTNPDPAFLRQNYGNSDYDTPNYFSGNYVFTLPYWRGPKVLAKGWEVAGTAFHSNGLPFTFTDSTTSGTNFSNYGGALYAQQAVPHLDRKCSGNNIYNPVSGVSPQCKGALEILPATGFGQQERNQAFGPDYTDTDMSVYKSFDVPKHDSAHLKLGVQFFNILNHPNFGQPAHDLAPCYTTNPATNVTTFTGCAGTTVGTIAGTVNTPTSILGSFLGGDASPRLIQLKANFNF